MLRPFFGVEAHYTYKFKGQSSKFIDLWGRPGQSQKAWSEKRRNVFDVSRNGEACIPFSLSVFSPGLKLLFAITRTTRNGIHSRFNRTYRITLAGAASRPRTPISRSQTQPSATRRYAVREGSNIFVYFKREGGSLSRPLSEYQSHPRKLVCQYHSHFYSLVYYQHSTLYSFLAYYTKLKKKNYMYLFANFQVI